MTKKIKTSGSIWSEGDPNALKKLAIQIDLENYKKTNDPSRLASIASYLDFYGLEEVRDIFIDYFDKKTRRTDKYAKELLWQNLCDIYFAMKKRPEWKDAPHEAIANEMFRKFGHRVKSNSDEAFASTLAKQIKKYR